MPVLLSDAAAAKWRLGHTRSQVGDVSISPVTGTSLQLLPRDRMGDITTPFEPSAFFRGPGTRFGRACSSPSQTMSTRALPRSRPGSREPWRSHTPSGTPRSDPQGQDQRLGAPRVPGVRCRGPASGIPDGLEGTPSDSGHRGSRRVQSLDWGGAAPGGHGIDDRRASGQERHVLVSSTVLRAGFLG